MIKTIVIIAFILIIVSLGTALYSLIVHKPEEQSKNTVKALTFRIGLSILLFIFIFIAVATGIVKPHGISENIQKNRPTQTETTK